MGRIKTINALTARTHLGQIMKLADEGEAFVLTKKGKAKVALIGIDEYENLLETLAEQRDQELQHALAESAAQIARGEISSLEALKTIYQGK